MTNSFRSFALKCAVAVGAATILGCGPGDGSKEFEQGKEAFARRDLKKAERLFERSASLAPQDADRILYLVRAELELGEMQKAQDAVGRLPAGVSGDADVLLLKAQIAWHVKDYKSAEVLFGAVADNAKLDASVRAQGWAGLGVVAMTQVKSHLARVAFLRALGLDKLNAAARYHLGVLYKEDVYQFKYYEAAREQFDIFVRLEKESGPRVQKVQNNIMHSLAELCTQKEVDLLGAARRDSAASASVLATADAAFKKGNFRNARDAYQKALDADPLSFPAALGLAKSWEKTDTSKAGMRRAFECYARACTLRHSAIQTFLTAGALGAKLGYHQQCVEIYSRAIAAVPTKLDAIDGLIRALRKCGGAENEKIAAAYQRYRDSLKK